MTIKLEIKQRRREENHEQKRKRESKEWNDRKRRTKGKRKIDIKNQSNEMRA